jgi:hypothetical protein
MADHKRKAAAARTPYLNVFDRRDHATELHVEPESSPPRPGMDIGLASRKMQAH